MRKYMDALCDLAIQIYLEVEYLSLPVVFAIYHALDCAQSPAGL